MKMSPRKIVHLVYECTPGKFSGGVSKVAYELAKAQSALSPTEVWACNRDEEHTWEKDRLPIRRLKSVSVGKVRIALGLNEKFTKHRDEIYCLHCHNTFHPLNLQAGFYARRLGLPIFYHSHGALDPKLLIGFQFRQLKKLLYAKFFEVPNLNRANGVFALTSKEVLQLRRMGVNSDIIQVSNGINNPKEFPFIEKYGQQTADRFSSERLSILYIGRIARKKGIERIIEAFALVRKAIPDVALLIAGREDEDINYTRELRDLAVKLDVAHSVVWLGFVDESAKPSILRRADAFVHASTSEGMSLSILEAMSYGIPVVATSGCYMDRAEKKGAIVVSPPDPKGIAQCLSKVLSDEGLVKELKVLSKRYIQVHHSWTTIARTVNCAYGGLLKKSCDMTNGRIESKVFAISKRCMPRRYNRRSARLAISS